VQFTSHTITTDANGAESVYAIDVDGDGDMDVLSASSTDAKIAWYENDGNENFSAHTITNVGTAKSVYAVDVDGDGDIDVLSASGLGDRIAWYENDGNENFTPHTITTNADIAWSVYAIDVDGDGDIDVLSASWRDHKLAWYENTSVVGVESISNDIPDEFRLSQNYPNPFNPSTTIRFSMPEESFVTIKVFNTLGEEITTLINENIIAGNYEIEFDASKLPSGIYIYRLQAGDPSTSSGQSFVETQKMVLIK